MLKRKIVLIIIIIILIIGGLVYTYLRFQRGNIPKDYVLEKEIMTIEPGELQYEIVRIGRIADPIAKIMTYDVVAENMDVQKVRAMAEKIISDINREDPDIDHISILFFTDRNLIETHLPNIARAIWWPETGGITSEIAEKNLRDNYIVSVIMKESIPVLR
ncbi:MAG: hypothetical protein DDT30_02164 [Dehalococcoidia bacterium]|nr:hypothetical protein [Bacillota bacterium]